MRSPLEKFLEEALRAFERERAGASLAPGARNQRPRGARQSVAFLLGRPPAKGEALKDLAGN